MMDLFSFSYLPPEGGSSPIGLEIGELDSYLNANQLPPLEIQSPGVNGSFFPASTYDFPEYHQLRSNNYHHPLYSPATEFPVVNSYEDFTNNAEDLLTSSVTPPSAIVLEELPPKEEEPKKRKRRPEPMTDVCRICGDIAPPHNHYGAIACFSCRAFFGRTVHKGTQERFRCVRGNPDESGQCLVTKATRTHCPFCRYRGCLSAGMKPAYVTTAEERLMKKKKSVSRRGKRLVVQLHEGLDYRELPTFRVIAVINIPLSTSGSYPTMCFMIEQNQHVEHRIQCRHYTWHSIAIGVSLILELIRVGSKVLAPSNDIEIEVQLIESRPKSSDMSPINLQERKDPVLRVNVSSIFSARVGLKEQLLETIGSKDYVVQKTPPPQETTETLLSLKQVFTNPWGVEQDTLSKIDLTLERMEKLNLEPKVECLLSVIPFFGGTDNPFETEFLSKVQEEINMVLFQHVYKSAGPRHGKNLFSKIMSVIVDLQEMVTLCRKKPLDFKIAPFGISQKECY